MAFKTITIKEGVYKRLSNIKKKNESFSELLARLAKTRRPNLMRYYGAWKGTKKELNNVEGILKRERLKKEERMIYSETWK